MANQMIALQARAPQASGLGGAIQQNAQVINMLAQQKVAERQALQAQQKMALEAELAAPQLAKAKSEAFSADQKALTDFFDVAAKVIGLSKSPEDVQFGANMLKQRFDNPLFAQMIDQTIKDMPADPQAFGAWRNQTKLETLDAKDQVPYFFEQVKNKELIGESGDVGVLTTGGLGAPTIKTPRTLVPETRKREVTVSEPTFDDGGVGGPATVDAVADLAGGIASARNDREYQDALALLDQTNPDVAASVRRAMPRFDPARIEGIRAEFSRAFGGQAGAPLVAGDRGGMGGPDEGYIEAPTPFRAKNPMQAPMPGSAIVPIQRVREEAAAQRRTPGETYQEQRSQEQAKSDVAFLDAYESSKSDAQNILSVIDQMIGDLNVKDGKIVQGKRPPHPGFEGVIGAGVPGVRFIPGTQAADFDAFMEQVQGGAFLKAYNALRGTGQITEKEGEKATTALSRMKRSQSEAGFIKAAREFEGVVRSAVRRADARAARLRGGTPTTKRNIDDLLKKYGD